jgi:hypothetical protein
VPIVGVEAIAPERGDINWRDYYIDALRAFDEPLIHRKISNPEPLPAHGSPAQYIPRRIDSRSVLRVALESAIRQRRPLAFLVDEAQHLAKIAGGRKLQDQLDCLKSLAIRTQTVHVLAGTYDLLILRQLSGQLSRRTRHIHFARYRVDTVEDVRDFQNVLWNFPHSTEFSGGAPTPFVIPLKLCSLIPILGHHLQRPSDQRVTHAQHRSPDPRQSDYHHRFPERSDLLSAAW